MLGDEGRPSASLDTKEKDSRGPRERASMKEYSLSTLSCLSAVPNARCCEFIIEDETGWMYGRGSLFRGIQDAGATGFMAPKPESAQALWSCGRGRSGPRRRAISTLALRSVPDQPQHLRCALTTGMKEEGVVWRATDLPDCAAQSQ